ncbi:cobalamin B12-binding domain-containing protein [Candidatus Korarchaeum cryptofilum]|uniref:Methionine synthase n=1 Tax=Korarchaeum cryptofilum (strain OPF8) TaxID=374847 RepID=B1L5Q1_KORCO|nr:corrinoid protein [Candidatus Korarchaeum cryptofilum]ACB07780.1 Methionine synthase [Candidatus Korarchaeum cryptofilum OPF8]
MSLREKEILLKDSLVNLDEESFMKYLEELISSGEDPWKIILGPMSEAMEEIGKLFEEGEYFIAEMLKAASIFKKALDKLGIGAEGGGNLGTVVIGTVKGDVHDIGKSLVATMLKASGFKVIDLGVDVDADTFIRAVKEYRADILAMSSLLTTTRDYMSVVIRRLEEEGLRERVKVLIGGLSTSPEFAKSIGADGWAKNAIEAVEVAKSLLRNARA